MIQNVLYRLAAYDVMEQLGRLDILLDQLGQTAAPVGTNPAPLANRLKQQTMSVKRQLVQERCAFHKLYGDTLEAEDSLAATPHKTGKTVKEPKESASSVSTTEETKCWNALLPVLQKTQETLSTVLNQVAPCWHTTLPEASNSLCPEILQFSREALPLSLLTPKTERIILPQITGTSLFGTSVEGDAIPLADGLLIETIPVLNRSNILGWLDAGNQYIAQLVATAQNTLYAAVGLKTIPATETAMIWNTLFSALVRVRLFGPAAYFEQLPKAIRVQNGTFFRQVEPWMFQALSYQNFMDKSLVICHEAAEKLSQSLTAENGAGGDASQLPATVLKQSGVFARLMHTLGTLVPERYGFHEKQFQRALALQDRLAKGMMLSASLPYAFGDVSSKILESVHQLSDETLATPLGSTNAPTLPANGALNGVEVSGDIYQTLRLMTEEPHSALEIMNAAWLFRLNRVSAWLYDVLQDGEVTSVELLGTGVAKSEKRITILNPLTPGVDAIPQELAGFERLKSRLVRYDDLYLKSLETAEVHRVVSGLTQSTVAAGAGSR